MDKQRRSQSKENDVSLHNTNNKNKKKMRALVLQGGGALDYSNILLDGYIH
jgi:hypothetical protein